MTPLARFRSLIGGASGNLVEWYDWFAYSVFALYFAPVFFPAGDEVAQLLQAAAVFAVGFLARPVGAWLMGLYADRAGRRTALALSVGMMSLGSLMIAVTPGYAVIGSAAPVILVIARLIQGLSTGGEYGASATYISEMAGRERRGLWSSFQCVTLVAGQLLALGTLLVLQQILPTADLESWGWRIPFVIGAVLSVIVFWIRRGLVESPSFENLSPGERVGTRALLTENRRATVTVFLLTAAGAVGFYVYATYMQKYLVTSGGFTRSEATGIQAAALGVFMLCQPLFGALSDRFGRRPMLMFAFAAGALLTYPVLTALPHVTSAYNAFFLVLVPLIALSGYTSIGAVVKAELFPANIRALGVALPYAMANAIFGGTTEYIALWFKSSGMDTAFPLYVTAMMVFGLVVAIAMPDTKQTSLILED